MIFTIPDELPILAFKLGRVPPALLFLLPPVVPELILIAQLISSWAVLRPFLKKQMSLSTGVQVGHEHRVPQTAPLKQEHGQEIEVMSDVSSQICKGDQTHKKAYS